jgi:hypothetical protein
MKQLSVLLLAAALVAAGCSGGGSKRIDTTTPESAKQSMAEITKGMSAAEKEKFDAAVMTIGAKHIFGNMMKEGVDPEKEAFKALHGKTAAEVIAEAEKIRAESKK